MFRKSSIWVVILISFITAAVITCIAAGCAKKQVVKEEAVPKPVAEAKPAPPAPAPPVTPPPAPAPAPAPAPVILPPPKVEAKPEAAPKAEAKPASLDLSGMRIQFAFDDYTLSKKAEDNLNRIGSWMKEDLSARIQIQGNTCDIGTAEYNLALGDRRANSAKKYLEGLGVDSARLLTISYGEEKPKVPNTDETNRSLNRRDEFVPAK